MKFNPFGNNRGRKLTDKNGRLSTIKRNIMEDDASNDKGPGKESGLESGRIFMNRGTVIDAHHIKAHVRTGGKPYLLVGIGPGIRQKRYKSFSYPDKRINHPDFATAKYVGQTTVGNDPKTRTTYAVTYKFDKILTINPKNIDRIEWATGAIDKFNELTESTVRKNTIKHNYKTRLNESLYGYRVTDSNEKIDKLLRAIDDLYYDFDPDSPKFQKLVVKIYDQPLTADQLANEIKSSSQSDDLKSKLLGLIKQNPTTTSNSQHRPCRITMKSGRVINADHHVDEGSWYRVGITPMVHKGVISTSRRGSVPGFTNRVKVSTKQTFGGKSRPLYQTTYYFKTMLTINKSNIATIDQ